MTRFALWSLLAGFSLVPSFAAAQTAQAVTIAWDANTEPGVVGYRVYVGPATNLFDEVFDVGPLTQFTYRTVIAGQRYYFAVSAYAVGPLEGPRSAAISTIVGDSTGGGGSGGDGGSTGGGTGGGGGGGGNGGGGGGGDPTGGPPPPAPAPTPGPDPTSPGVAMHAPVVSGGLVSLSWSPVGGLNAAEYLLEAGSAPGLSNVFNASVGAVTSMSASVAAGTYYVRVRARTPGGETTAASNEVTVAVGTGGFPACTTPPAVPTAVSGFIGAGQATVNWAGSQGATSYRVQAGSQPGRSDLYDGHVGAATTVSAVVPPGLTAYVRVNAMNACGQSAASAEFFLQ
jgi:hypothetical protein